VSDANICNEPSVSTSIMLTCIQQSIVSQSVDNAKNHMPTFGHLLQRIQTKLQLAVSVHFFFLHSQQQIDISISYYSMHTFVATNSELCARDRCSPAVRTWPRFSAYLQVALARWTAAIMYCSFSYGSSQHTAKACLSSQYVARETIFSTYGTPNKALFLPLTC